MPSYTTTHTSRRMHPKAQADYLQAWKEYNKESEKGSVSEASNIAPAVQSSAPQVSAHHESKASAPVHIPRRMHPKAQEEYLATWAEYTKLSENDSKSSAPAQSPPTNMYAMPVGGEKQFLGMSYMMDKHRPLPAADKIASNKDFQEWKSKVVATPTSSRASSVSTASTSPTPAPVTAKAEVAETEAAKTEANVQTPIIVQSTHTPSPAPQTSTARQRPARQSRPRNQVSRQAPSRTSTAARPREELPAGNAWGNFTNVVKQDDDAHVAKAHANKAKYAGQLAEFTTMHKDKEGKTDVAKFEKVVSDKVETE
jgi:hypothetical protein